jgi:DNA-binding MurR/RpiR family transcriptional regulator
MEVTMKQTVKQRLQESLLSSTASSRTIAAYMLANLQNLPFETSAMIAEKLELSESTIGRYCRSLGYAHFKALKNDLQADLGDGPWLMGDRLKEFLGRAPDDSEGPSRGLQKEIAALVQVHEHALKPSWKRLSERLAKVPRVYAAGFQTERGIAMTFVHLLQYLRDGVQLVDGSAGNFSDVLLSPPNDTALIVFEARRYSRHALMLCERAKEAGIPVSLVTDNFCDWADQHADEVFRVQTEVDLFWESTASMLSLVHLLINDVFKHLGADVERRLQAIGALHSEFVGYTSSNPSSN